jgi:hypothetical protein
MNGEHISAAGEQLRGLHVAVQADPTIPDAHKSILNRIINFLLAFLPSIFGTFTNADGDVHPALAAPVASPQLAGTLSAAHDEVSEHPISESLAKAVATAGAGATPEGKGILDKIFGFILQILPTVLGLFSHSLALTSSVPGSQPSVSAGTAGNVAGAVDGKVVEGTGATE